MTEVMSFSSDNVPEQTDLAEAAIDKALALAPDNAYAHHCRGHVLYARRRARRRRCANSSSR